MNRPAAKLTRRLIAAALTLAPASMSLGSVMPASDPGPTASADVRATAADVVTPASVAWHTTCRATALKAALSRGNVLAVASFVGDTSATPASPLAVSSSASPTLALVGESPAPTFEGGSALNTLDESARAASGISLYDDTQTTSAIKSPRRLVGLAQVALLGR